MNIPNDNDINAEKNNMIKKSVKGQKSTILKFLESFNKQKQESKF